LKKIFHVVPSQVFYWHMVSRFAPENLMFRTAVVEYQNAVRSGNVAEAREKVRLVESRYLGETSAFEVNRQTSTTTLSELPDAELKTDLFDNVLGQIDRDLGRALQTLWASSVFKVRATEWTGVALTHAFFVRCSSSIARLWMRSTRGRLR
jgi:hypothetical protein